MLIPGVHCSGCNIDLGRCGDVREREFLAWLEAAMVWTFDYVRTFCYLG